jgi:hypothetical protein
MPEQAPQGSARTKPLRWLKVGSLAAIGAVAGKLLLIWLSDAVFAPPIIGLALWLGFWKAFLISTVAYATGSYVLSIVAVRALDRALEGSPSRLATFLAKQRQSLRGRRAERLVVPGGIAGITVSSVLVGGVLTSGLWYYAGARSHIHAIAAYSSLVFALSFAAFYAGNTAALF